MAYASIHRMHADDTDAALAWSDELVEEFDFARLAERPLSVDVEPENGTDATVVPIDQAAVRRKGGAPARLPQYTVAMVMKVIIEMAWRGDTFTWTRVAFALWYRYTEDQMAAIGHRGWRDPSRAAAMRPAALESETGRSRVPNADDLKRRQVSEKMWRAEVNRLQEQMTRQMAPIDDTPLPAARRHSISATQEARTAEHDAARVLRREVQARLVKAGLVVANAEYYPEVDRNDLAAGLLRDFKGDVGVDEHNVVVSTRYGQRAKVRSAKPLARYSTHVRREGHAMAIGLSAAIAVGRPDSPKVPPVLVGFDLHDVGSEAHAGARNALAAMEAVGLRPKLQGRGHQYVVTDKAYPRYVGFVRHLLENKWTILGKYVTGTDQIKGSAPYADMSPAGSGTSGPYQFNGTFLCPGVGANYLYENRGFDIPSDQDMTTEWLASNEDKVRQLSAAVMPTNGRPKPRKQRGRGRPAAGARPIENEWTIEVFCPAASANAKVRCPRVSTSMDLPISDFPTLEHAPKADDPAPKCCTDKFGAMQLVLDERHIKNYQTKMAGSWEHQDFYAPARTTTETYFGRLMDRDSGDLTNGKIEWQRNAFVALAITATILVTNKRAIDKWEADLRDSAYVVAPGAGARRREWRRYLASQ